MPPRAIAVLRRLAGDLRARRNALTVPGSTINVGAVLGGLAANIVPGLCEFEWEMRAIPGSHHVDVQTRFEAFLREP
ncbi:hypothetical protein E1263_12950 [Kribbella antibiotica]|uniref:Peptidase M20 dimerisation domain-containing protein n=1 Tax=Kribbella antibiotica TaxID=190195 RepID=A0A4R4ZQ55_9ACTN|nr:hypothetical protein E1263_12950 [Kribbella antibiotica]